MRRQSSSNLMLWGLAAAGAVLYLRSKTAVASTANPAAGTVYESEMAKLLRQQEAARLAAQGIMAPPYNGENIIDPGAYF